MRAVRPPRVHLFVCANRRQGSPLGPGCGARGDELYDALKREVSVRGEIADVWVTRTHCLGVCPERGATVARYAPPSSGAIYAEATPDDARELLASPDADDAHRELDREIDALEELQRSKVLALARRLKPGLTLEDIQNPHDFPELDDSDWHYADGVLAGIQSVKSAARALKGGSRR